MAYEIFTESDEDIEELSSAASELKKSVGKFKKNSKSIIKAAKGNIFEFPVFVAKSVPLDYATATTSLLEQVYASYLQMAISINPVIDDDMARKGAQFDHLRTDVNKYLECVDPTEMPYAYDACHAVYNENGIVTEFNLVNIEDSVAKIINEAVDHQPLSEFDHFFKESAYSGDGAGFFEGCEFIQEAPSTTQDNWNDTEYTYTDRNGNVHNTGLYYHTWTGNEPEFLDWQDDLANRQNGWVSNDDIRQELDKRMSKELDAARKEYRAGREFAKLNADEQASAEEMRKADAKRAADIAKLNADKAKAELDTAINRTKHEWEQEDRDQKKELLGKEVEKATKDIEKLNLDIERSRRQADWDKEDRHLDRMKKMNDARVKTPQFLDESKIQKLNTMKPLMMSVDLNVVDKNGSLSRPVSYVVGVKCHIRLIDSDILPEVAAYPLKEMNKNLRKVKWRAGELKFGRDILWKKTAKKQTAADSKDPKRKWYRRLYELAHMSGDGTAAASVKNDKSPWANWWQDKLSGGNNKDVGHGLIPNATIVMSKSDVDNIKREKNIDLLNGKKAAKFCKELFLIGLIVIDNDAESVKVMLPDLHDDYEVQSISAINKQLATLDTAGSKTRDIMKLLG